MVACGSTSERGSNGAEGPSHEVPAEPGTRVELKLESNTADALEEIVCCRTLDAAFAAPKNDHAVSLLSGELEQYTYATFPWGVRAVLGYDKELGRAAASAFAKELSRSLKRRATRARPFKRFVSIEQRAALLGRYEVIHGDARRVGTTNA